MFSKDALAYINEIVAERIQLVLPRQGVDGHIDALAPAVRELHRAAQTVVVKVRRRGAHAEAAPGEIHGVRAVAQRHFQPLEIPRGGEQLIIVTNNPV